MNLVDSCGWLEYYADGRNAPFFAPAIEDTANLLVPTICVLEVYKRMHQQRGREFAYRALAGMQAGYVVDLDAALAVAAAHVGLATGLPLADSIVLATARAHDAVLWTQDAHFEGMDGVRYAPA